jgi:hypothetical protein
MTDVQDQLIDDLLRREFGRAIPDDGFSSRVVAALPARERPRQWMVPTALVAGGASAWASLWPAELWPLAAEAWAAGSPAAPIMVTLALGLAMGFVACAWALAETD